MSQVCILTDSTAQFPIPAFAGRTLVSLIPLHIEWNQKRYEKSEGIRAADLPTTTRLDAPPTLMPPSKEEFEKTYLHLGQYYEEILVLVNSAQLTGTYQNAKQAAAAYQGKTKIITVDSETAATGLGLLVQAASAAAEDGAGAEEIDNFIRQLLPRMYSVFCIQGLSYLHHSGYLGEPQAIVGEFLHILPMYVLDRGHLVPTQKARNNRHLVDLLHEFICEFTSLEHIGLLQGVPPYETETRSLRERLALDFEDTPISEHIISAELAALIGPRSLGLFVLQTE